MIRSSGKFGAMLLLCLGAVQEANATIPVRYGDHLGFGRVVFDSSDGRSLLVTRTAGMVSVSVEKAILPGGSLPRNVRAIHADPGQVTIELIDGVGVRQSMVGTRLVLDITDPAVPSAASAQASIRPGEPNASNRTRPVQPASFVRSRPERPQLPTPPPPPPAMDHGEAREATDVLGEPLGSKAAEPSVEHAPEPEHLLAAPETALAAEVRSVPDRGPGHQLSVPFALQVGAAAFRRGREGIVVFDARKPIDLQRLKDDPVFGSATVQLLPAATILRVPLAATAELRLSRRNGSWIVTAVGGDAIPSALQPIEPDYAKGSVRLPAHQPGLVLTIPDLETGGVLVVGTQLVEGEGVVVARRTPDFTLVPTWQGVALDPAADMIGLRATPSGFLLASGPSGEVLSSGTADPSDVIMSEASRMSRVLDLPNLSTEALLRRMQGAVLAASQAPSQNRSVPRRRVAEAMLALGMASEADAVLKIAATEDARSDQETSARMLSGIVGLLTRRSEDASELDDPALDGTDEIAFWRAIRLAQKSEGSPEAAAVFAAKLPLLRTYPAGLQRKVMPLVAETMARGGQLDAAHTLVSRSQDDTSLDLARALLAEKSDAPAARTLYDKLAVSPDRLVRLRASRQDVEARIADGSMKPGQAAEILGKMLFAWRGDARELDLRLRVAELLEQSGQLRQALTLLRETEHDWPEQQEAVHSRLKAVLATALEPAAAAKLSSFDLVAMAGENADLIPDGEPGRALAERLIDHLAALDLPDRTGPLLEKLINAAPRGVARASFGGRLAAIRLQQARPEDAVSVLGATAADSLPPALLESRTLVFASAIAREGDLPAASNALQQLDTEAGDARSAELAEQARQWPQAVTALKRYAARLVPPSGMLDESQASIVLRLAGAALEAGDEPVLADLRAHDISRLAPGKTADLLRLMTSRPVRSIGDLPLGGRDIALARTVQAAMPSASAR